MDFKLSNNGYSQYNELIITDDNVKLKSGLLNDAESKEIAIQLINVAADLIKKQNHEIWDKLTDMANEL
jgi:hypothetical protein